MTHLNASSAFSLHASHLVVMGQRAFSISAHESISSEEGMESISSSLGIREKHRFCIAQGRRSLSSDAKHTSELEKENS